MNSIFAKKYETEQAIRAQYEAAEQAQDKAGQEAARTAYQAHQDSLAALGEGFRRIYSIYSSAQKRGNEFVDIHEIVWDDQVEGMIAAFREYGIEKFTFSGTWSGAIETAWFFIQNGCTMEGFVELNSQFKSILTNDYEKIHGLLFRIS